MRTGFLTRAVSIPHSNEIGGITKISHGLKEIEELNINADCIIEIGEMVAYL